MYFLPDGPAGRLPRCGRYSGNLPTVRRCVAAIALVLAFVALLGSPGTALADSPRPTADPAEPSPVVPDPTGPPRGTAPNGDTVGGADLDARGLVLPSGATPLPIGIDAHGWLVADASSGEVLAALDPHGRYYPASTLKLLTMLSLYPRLDPAMVVTATAEDEHVEGSRVGLIEGGRYDVATLWLGLMLQSGNDAANALARAAGGIGPTLDAMYKVADRLQAYDTSPGGPSGLDAHEQRSSPYDLALLMTAAAADPALLAVMTTTQAQIPGVAGRDPGFQIQNENRFLANYPDAVAGKSGFTDAARHTLAAVAERDGRRLVVSLMQAEQTPVPVWQQAAALLDWAFALPPSTPAVGELVGPVSAEAPAGTDAAASTSSAAPALGVSSAAQFSGTTSLAVPLLALIAGAVATALGVALWLRRHRVPRRPARR